MSPLESQIINELQGGFPVSENPFAEVAGRLGVSEEQVMSGIQGLLNDGMLSRFGPLYHAERMGGGLTLAAMSIPESDFDRVAAIVNGFPEVAHNYERDHEFNMWFVVATDKPEQVGNVLEHIQSQAGYTVFNMPKEQEFFIGLRLEA
ncbi:MAG: Lrp/AsnC family transcriptional regulator [Gammaproteobacteria bacterium]|nr:Lrp/AsnC family transcriptional regulator [Gammaproteobacteria bacterium]